MRRFFRSLCAVLTPLCLAVQAAIGFYAAEVPSAYVVSQGNGLTLPAPLSASAQAVSAGTAEYGATLKLLGMFPVKDVSVRAADETEVVLGGNVFGMKLYTSGVLVVGLTDVDAAPGNCNPAADAGVRVGDVIESINGHKVTTKAEVAELVERSCGQTMTVRVARDGVTSTVRFAAVLSQAENRYKAGLWVRDSSAGIGTMTFYIPATGAFAGLGHPICDVDTGDILPISSGEVVPARIYSITRGVNGDAGELCGGFDGEAYGVLTQNGENGVYGVLDSSVPDGMTVSVASRQEVEEGEARIYCTLDQSGPHWYDVRITKVRYMGGASDMEIEVTDRELVERTGGIVQGMSGSPIVQNGKLVGAVTHVLVDDPTKGYGIFAETMLGTAQSAAKSEMREAS